MLQGEWQRAKRREWVSVNACARCVGFCPVCEFADVTFSRPGVLRWAGRTAAGGQWTWKKTCSFRSSRSAAAPLKFSLCHARSQVAWWGLGLKVAALFDSLLLSHCVTNSCAERPSVFFPSLFPNNPGRRRTRPADLLSLLQFLTLSLCANGARHLGVDKWSLSRQVLWERFALSGLHWSCPCKTSGPIHSLSWSRLYLQTKITEHFSRIRRPRKNTLLISGVPCYQRTL